MAVSKILPVFLKYEIKNGVNGVNVEIWAEIFKI